jgi:hypothetical protein
LAAVVLCCSEPRQIGLGRARWRAYSDYCIRAGSAPVVVVSQTLVNARDFLVANTENYMAIKDCCD